MQRNKRHSLGSQKVTKPATCFQMQNSSVRPHSQRMNAKASDWESASCRSSVSSTICLMSISLKLYSYLQGLIWGQHNHFPRDNKKDTTSVQELLLALTWGAFNTQSPRSLSFLQLRRLRICQKRSTIQEASY